MPNRRVTLNDLTWLVYIIEPPDMNIGAWHDSNTLHTLPRINIEVQDIRYTSEYILKLQIHQHSLLTRKVFSWRNLLARVFFSVSSGSSMSSRHLHLQVIFITGSRSSSMDLDHHLIWIIISGFRSSLDLDHHWVIITRSRSSLLDHHHQCYLLILLVIGSSTKPSLFSCWL